MRYVEPNGMTLSAMREVLFLWIWRGTGRAT